MGLWPHQRAALRLKLRDVLWKFHPRADAIDVGEAVLALMRLLDRSQIGSFMGEPPTPDCACWDCVLRLQAAVVQQQARWAVAELEEREID
jgi:hypothetical protein